MRWTSNPRGMALFGLLATVGLSTQAAFGGQPSKADAGTLVVVNGTAITQSDLQSMMLSRGVPPSLQAAVRTVLIERLIDDQLMREFLESRKVAAPKVLLDRAVSRVLQQIRRKGRKPDEELKKLGLDEAALRRKLALPIAWGVYARQVIGDREIRGEFMQRRAEYDGTRLRARQIVLKRPADTAARMKAVQRLDAIRSEILSGKTTFADAARKHSTAPSRNNGGDVGFFAYDGNMPRDIARVAFTLKGDEISKPFVTQFGVHILQVSERKPGQLSLEDARPEIFRRLAEDRWNELVAKLRKQAKIERKRPEK